MKFTHTLYFYALLAKAMVQEWKKNARTARHLIAQGWHVYRASPPRAFVAWALTHCLIPNYRLKTKIALGRPSPTIFRKFHDTIQADEAWCSPAGVTLRQQPRYLLMRDGAMGDVLMLTPVVKALHARHGGDIAIDIATHAPAVFDHNPYVRAVLNPKLLGRGVHTYDVVVDLNDAYERSPNTHPVKAYGKWVLGMAEFEPKLELHPTHKDVALIDAVVAEIGGPYLVVHHFRHEWPNREIDALVWDSLLDGLAQQGQFKIVFVGVARDHAEIRHANFLDHRGRYTLQQLSVLIAKSHGFVGGDSGPSHIAATTDAPMCVFYTCAHHEARKPLRQGGRFLPLTPELDCYGCLTRSVVARPGYFCARGDNACVRAFDMSRITPRVLNFFEGKS